MGMSTYKSKSESIKSTKSSSSSPSAVVQWAGLSSKPSCSLTSSTVACSVAGSCNWSDVTDSGFEAMFSSVALLGDGLLVAVGSGSPSAVGSGWGSAQQGNRGLGSGSEVGLVWSSAMSTVSANPQDTSTHSTKVAKFPRGPSPDNRAPPPSFRLVL